MIFYTAAQCEWKACNILPQLSLTQETRELLFLVYSNLQQLPLTKTTQVFMSTTGSHRGFLNAVKSGIRFHQIADTLYLCFIVWIYLKIFDLSVVVASRFKLYMGIWRRVGTWSKIPLFWHWAELKLSEWQITKSILDFSVVISHTLQWHNYGWTAGRRENYYFIFSVMSQKMQCVFYSWNLNKQTFRRRNAVEVVQWLVLFR